jgi:hypothetical protein
MKKNRTMIKKQLDYRAKLIIYDLPTMCPKDKRRMIQWLLNAAEEVENCCPAEFDKKYTLKLMK